MKTQNSKNREQFRSSFKKENFVKSMSVRSLFIDDKSNEIFISFTYHEPKTKCVGWNWLLQILITFKI